MLLKEIPAEEEEKGKDAGFQWQLTPQRNRRTHACLAAAALGELWPSFLPRVGGHQLDPDLPVDLGPPHGMEAFHGFDLYCQILVRLLMILRSPTPLEQLREFSDLDDLNTLEGRLVSFRERAIGKGVKSPRAYEKYPTSRVRFRKKKGGHIY